MYPTPVVPVWVGKDENHLEEQFSRNKKEMFRGIIIEK